ncbi:MAG: arsenic resistance N-acetyltransferase ArsN2 [Niastella sp.]|jgi:amino-acid N-acetyltransferase|uniref:arsenic resistance N-acetyltransferase ArsN2 n=1 Tax=Niastella sp. TaxID=1869183 RepID=UPI00389AA6AF
MDTISQIKIAKAGNEQRQAIITLLQSEKLPVEDLPASMENFFVALNADKVIGAIGLEQYDNCGLLRSMVVDKEYRNKNTASQLLQELETYAIALSIDCMYLLTETAPGYFGKKGYQKIAREEAPRAIHASSEFSHVCPVSAIVMKKEFIAV